VAGPSIERERHYRGSNEKKAAYIVRYAHGPFVPVCMVMLFLRQAYNIPDPSLLMRKKVSRAVTQVRVSRSRIKRYIFAFVVL
jgi:hypothetical protein